MTTKTERRVSNGYKDKRTNRSPERAGEVDGEMMAVLGFQCSSRKNRRLPNIPAFCGVAGRCVEKDWIALDFVPHNMGLCGTDGRGGEGGWHSFRFAGGGAGVRARKIIDDGQKWPSC